MPQLTNIIENRSKNKFIKKNYRPWNLSGEKLDQTIESNDCNLDLLSSVTSNPQDLKTSENKSTHNDEDIQINSICIEDKIILNNNQITNREHIDNNQVTNRGHIDNNQVTNREHIDNNQGTNRGSIREQLDNTLDPNSLRNRIAKLSGIQKKILEFLVEICVARDSLETGPIETSLISQRILTTYGTTKTSIKRLILKGLLNRGQGRTAKGGYINLLIPNEIKDFVIELQQKNPCHATSMDFANSIREQIDNKIDNKNAYSSSNINTTTTELPVDFKKINIEPLSDIGFSKNQLKQLVGKNTTEIIQESIYHFSFALENNPKYKNHAQPLNVIMGVLRKGQGWFETNYRSAEEIALEQFLKQKEAEKERLKKLEEEVFNLAFNEWEENLGTVESLKILQKIGTSSDMIPKKVRLRSYFRENIWKEIKKEYLES